MELQVPQGDDEPQVVPEIEPQVVPEDEPQMVPEAEPQVVPENEPQVVPEDEPQVVPEYEHQAVPQNEPLGEPEDEPQVVPVIEPEVGPENEPQVVPENEPQVVPVNIPQAEPQGVPQNIPQLVPYCEEISKNDWNDMRKKGKYNKEDMNMMVMVMDFLIGHELAIVAKTFHKESGCPWILDSEDFSYVGTQKIVRDLIINRQTGNQKEKGAEMVRLEEYKLYQVVRFPVFSFDNS